MKRLCVFSGSRPGIRPEYLDHARRLGEAMAQRGYGLVYGGASVGLMGAMADAASAAGGEVIGVIPQALLDREIAHAGLTELRVVSSMHERKAMMAELSDAFIALPGGFGTFEELFEMVTWSQLGLHQKAVGLLNTAGFYDPWVSLVSHAIEEGFINRDNALLFLIGDHPEALLDGIKDYTPPKLDRKWLTRSET